jgi:hypothetical protein
MKKNNITDELLVKYLLDEVSDTEKKDVQDWINASIENKNHFNDLRLIWNQSRNLAVHTDINTDEAWARFKQRTQKPPANTHSIPSSYSFRWVKIAAILLLLAGGAGITYFIAKQNTREPVANHTSQNTAGEVVQRTGEISDSSSRVKNESTKDEVYEDIVKKSKRESETQVIPQQKAPIAGLQKKAGRKNKLNDLADDNKAKEFVCNSTPCPIEICIVQSIKCQNNHPAIISTCSTIEPDESGQLRYKAFGKMHKGCASTIREITIKRISTGETIVLTADSKPATAQDVFNYITGQKKGDITAGIFHSDCYNRDNEDGIIFNNKFGDLRLQ